MLITGLALLAILCVYTWLILHLKKYRELIVVLLIISGFVCGIYGFLHEPQAVGPCATEALGEEQRIFDAVYSTIRLVALEIDAKESHGIALGLARVVLPLATATALLLLLTVRLDQFRLRSMLFIQTWLPFAKLCPVIIIGTGKTGLKMARFYGKIIGKNRVYGIAQSLDCADVARFRNEGFNVLSSGQSPEDSLAWISIRPMQRIIICTGNDANDIRLTRHLLKVSEKSGDSKAPKILVSTDTPSLARLAEFEERLAEANSTGSLQFMDATHSAARWMLKEGAPHKHDKTKKFVRPADKDDCIKCHIGIYGTGDMLEAVVLQAVRALVYDPLEPLRITVFTNDAASLEGKIKIRYPALDSGNRAHEITALGGVLPLVHIKYEDSGYEQINIAAVNAAHAEQPFDVIYVVGDNDNQAGILMLEALKACDTLRSPRPTIVAAFENTESLKSPDVNKHNNEPDVWGRLDMINISEFWCNRPGAFPVPASTEATPDCYIDLIAKKIHYGYEHGWKYDYYKPLEWERWAKLPSRQKWFNRYAADHAKIKYALLDKPNDIGSALQEDAVKDWLIRLEHRRYICERMVDGWLCRGERAKANPYQLNPTLIPFDRLRADEKFKDDSIVNLTQEIVVAGSDD